MREREREEVRRSSHDGKGKFVEARGQEEEEDVPSFVSKST